MNSLRSRVCTAWLRKERGAALIFASLVCFAMPAMAEYRLDVGDVIEISVLGVPELRQRVPVQLDGSISYPLLGSFAVSGLSPSEVRAKIQAILPTKVFRQRASDGRESVAVIEPDQVTVGVVEYRPIYVNGDVSKPGEQTYRPRMTVRQAVALSGGYEIMRFRTSSNPFLESSDFRSEYESLWTEFAKEQAHVWRLRTELGNTDNPDQLVLREAPIAPSVLLQIAHLEDEKLKSRQREYDREKAFLQSAIKQSDTQIAVLSDQLQQEEQGVKEDSQDLQRITELLGKGAVTAPRLTDARRALLLSSTRKLQTTAQLMFQRRQRQDTARQLERLDDQRKVTLLNELQDAGVKINQIRARLQGVAEKIQYTALVRSQFVRGSGEKPEIAVVRSGPTGRERLIAEEDTELQPGDVVEVALRTGENPGPAQ
ncbi:polysaccharide biosynthesis/export family protein [Bradyrhizobium archetypum]|uniref:Exopolysaccharide biosynthesis protein n=1 Tax=Bradyrhizobium archetypum TaxID=2721160 RepID=A0A7Y4H4P8_9BRAD|nr:polysaccharide biosynthesis/export family protein [Bradyrhizobium archetypum]NOJ47561.1 exopolysaccharide biosynthesis protein [Bradyrhizobium archetypum]